ncbi:hypothetical protein KBC86_03180 [Candidatus Gracilibacteria bacterium]|nr:hypothetical protein [Candidatus Gracilibacteria bacterium]
MGIGNNTSSLREGELTPVNKLNVAGSYRRAANDEVFALLGDRIEGLPEGIKSIGRSIQKNALGAIEARAQLVPGVIAGDTNPALVNETIEQTRIAFYAKSPELKAA